jgi:hypothetical protein
MQANFAQGKVHSSSKRSAADTSVAVDIQKPAAAPESDLLRQVCPGFRLARSDPDHKVKVRWCFHADYFEAIVDDY